MSEQFSLFLQQQTWGHYIGKSSYPSDKAFLQEAERIGVSRRVPAFLAKVMNFGDRVILLRWLGKGKARAFAEMVIVGVTLNDEVAEKVAEALEDRIKCRNGGENQHHRGCGAYTITLTCVASGVTLSEIIEAAERATPKPFVMLQGRITRVFSPPEDFIKMRFTRGFFRFERLERLFTDIQQQQGTILGIRNYTRKSEPTPVRPEPKMIYPSLPLASVYRNEAPTPYEV